jgi:hypothetical protein
MLNTSLANVSEIIADFGYKQVCAQWVPHKLMSRMEKARLKAYQLLTTKASVTVFNHNHKRWGLDPPL